MMKTYQNPQEQYSQENIVVSIFKTYFREPRPSDIYPPVEEAVSAMQMDKSVSSTENNGRV